MGAIHQSVSIAVRALIRHRRVSLARWLVVTVVVTAVTAVFTVANAALLRPLPFHGASRLVRVYFQPPGTTAFADADTLDALAFVRFRDGTRTMGAFTGIFGNDHTVTGNGDPESIAAGDVTRGFFELLGGGAAIGRTFTDAEYATGAKVVVLGHGIWQRRFGADPSVIGRSLIVDREPRTIVGVTREGFEPGFTTSEFWMPMDLRTPNPYFSGIATIGQLQPGATPAQAAAELNALLPAVAKEVPAAYNGWKMGAIDLRDAQYGPRRPTILMLLAAVLGFTLIATSNLANITLADLLSRRSDFALRAVLGGSRFDIARTEITQAVIIAVGGAVAGLVAGSWLVRAVLALDPSNVINPAQLTIDWRIVLCSVGVATAVMAIAVAGPVLRIPAANLVDALRPGTRTTGGQSAHRWRMGFVVAQTALGIVLISAGARVVSSFQQASHIQPGFDSRQVVTAQLQLSETALPTPESRAVFVTNVIARLRETPGIVAASTTLNSFVAGQGGAQSLGFVEDRPNPDGAPYRIQSRRVTPGYFDTMRIPLVAGRDFAESDRAGGQSVAIVSRSFAERFWPGQPALGRRVKRGVTTKEWAQVIGVADDVRDVSIDEGPRDTLYTPFLQSALSPLPVTLVVRTSGDPSSFVRAIKQAIWQVDPHQALANIVTLDGFLHDSLGPQRFRALLVAAYGLLGLLLATIGTYGVTTRSVVDRTREVGVRLALGGQPRQVWWLVATSTMSAVVVGTIVGVVASIAAASALGALLPELQGSGWGSSVTAAFLLSTAGCAATLTAAWRVTSVDPLRALRG